VGLDGGSLGAGDELIAAGEDSAESFGFCGWARCQLLSSLVK
jgi:hypothetical protein